MISQSSLLVFSHSSSVAETILASNFAVDYFFLKALLLYFLIRLENSSLVTMLVGIDFLNALRI